VFFFVVLKKKNTDKKNIDLLCNDVQLHLLFISYFFILKRRSQRSHKSNTRIGRWGMCVINNCDINFLCAGKHVCVCVTYPKKKVLSKSKVTRQKMNPHVDAGFLQSTKKKTDTFEFFCVFVMQNFLSSLESLFFFNIPTLLIIIFLSQFLDKKRIRA